MSKASPPELKKFMDKRLGLQINNGRNLIGTLRGYDPFMNLVVDECVEKKKTGELIQVCRGDLIRNNHRKCENSMNSENLWNLKELKICGFLLAVATTSALAITALRFLSFPYFPSIKSFCYPVQIGMVVIRGNSVVTLEGLERIWRRQWQGRGRRRWMNLNYDLYRPWRRRNEFTVALDIQETDQLNIPDLWYLYQNIPVGIVTILYSRYLFIQALFHDTRYSDCFTGIFLLNT